MILDRDNIVNISRKHCLLDIKEYDLQINLCAMSLKDQLHLEDNSKDNKNKFIANMLLNCCVDEHGDKLFDSCDEVEQLPADLTLIIFKECLKLNNLGEKDIENIAKN